MWNNFYHIKDGMCISISAYWLSDNWAKYHDTWIQGLAYYFRNLSVYL